MPPKKKDLNLTPEEKFFKSFNRMAKVDFIGFILKDYFKERLIGKDEDSFEAAKLRAIIRVLEAKFNNQED